MLTLAKGLASSYLVLVTRTLTDAKIDARTFSHAQAELSGVSRTGPQHSVTLLCYFEDSFFRKETNSSHKQNNVCEIEDISVQGHYTFHRRRNE